MKVLIPLKGVLCPAGILKRVQLVWARNIARLRFSLLILLFTLLSLSIAQENLAQENHKNAGIEALLRPVLKEFRGKDPMQLSSDELMKVAEKLNEIVERSGSQLQVSSGAKIGMSYSFIESKRSKLEAEVEISEKGVSAGMAGSLANIVGSAKYTAGSDRSLGMEFLHGRSTHGKDGPDYYNQLLNPPEFDPAFTFALRST